jgi:hypothetical protein
MVLMSDGNDYPHIRGMILLLSQGDFLSGSPKLFNGIRQEILVDVEMSLMLSHFKDIMYYVNSDPEDPVPLGLEKADKLMQEIGVVEP